MIAKNSFKFCYFFSFMVNDSSMIISKSHEIPKSDLDK